MIKDYNKNIVIKDVTIGDVVTTIDFKDFDFGKCTNFTKSILDFKIGHLYMLQEILKILEQEHDVYIFTGYKNQ